MHFQWGIFAQLSITTTIIIKKLGKNYSRLIAWLFPWECAKFFVVSFVPFDFDRLKYRALTLWSLNSFPDSGRRRRPAKDIFDFHFFFIRICFLSLPCRSSCHSFFIYFVIFFLVNRRRARPTTICDTNFQEWIRTHTYKHTSKSQNTHTYTRTCIRVLIVSGNR